jgi:Transposase domain (DUF772)
MCIIPELLDYLRFLGYGLDDRIPDHSVLSKARKRWAKEVFVALFSGWSSSVWRRDWREDVRSMSIRV